jgi:N-glycosylase/DNA lyase
MSDPGDHIKEIHIELKEQIEDRLNEFRDIWEKKDSYSILRELFFCILTPQSKATTCWSAVENLTCNDLLFKGSYDDVLEIVGTVRFKYRKTSYILEAREKFIRDGEIIIANKLEKLKQPRQMREWLVDEVKGYGYKEASHFLRNIGLGEELTILDRHILKNLVRNGVIDKIPSSMTKKNYLQVEEKMLDFSKKMGIPASHLDLIWWYMEAGSIFK